MNSIITRYHQAVMMVILSLLSLPALKVNAQSQGPDNPAAATEQYFACLSCPGTDWFDFNYAKAPNDSFAFANLTTNRTCTAGSCFFSRTLYVSNFKFSIPLSATITGIEVTIKRKASAGLAVLDSSVTLLYNQVDTGSNYAMLLNWDTTNTLVTYGGASILWGLMTLTPAMVNDSVFGVGLKVKNISDTTQKAYVDNIQMTIYYSTPSIPPVAAFTANPTNTCVGNTVTFSDQSANAPTAWQWTFQGGIPSTSNSKNPQVVYAAVGSDSVKLVVSNAYGSDSLTKFNYIVVNPLPVPGISADTTICNGASVQLNASGGTNYQWSPCTGLSSCSTANPTASPSVNIKYYVQVTNANGCTASDSTTITVNSLPILTLSADTAICTGDTAELNVTGGTSYQWSPCADLSNCSSGNSYAWPSGNTTYRVQVVGADACTATGSITISVNPLPTLSTSGNTTICSGDTADLSVTGGTSYQWSPCTALSSCIISNPVASPSGNTTYMVLVTDANGCSACDSLTVTVNPSPPKPTIIVIGYLLNSTATSGNQWYLNDTAISGAIYQVYTASQTGSYTVVVTDSLGCKSVSSASYLTVTGIENVSAKHENIIVYPNPFSSDGFSYCVPASFAGEPAILYDLTGKELSRQVITEANGIFTNIHLSSGIYFLKIRDEMLKLVCE